MKWIEISKAKVKFNVFYLVASEKLDPQIGILHKSETTAKGIVHTFDVGAEEVIPVIATHVAVINNPNKSE